ncbi:MAG: hypothetical protein WD904_08845 [Dehalococcoidia bacterium]
MNIYAYEKLRELETERLSHTQPLPTLGPAPRPKSVFGPLASRTGRTLRRLGEGLESWANPNLGDCDDRAAAHQR